MTCLKNMHLHLNSNPLVYDILSWWKAGGLKYLTLHMIARDFLAILKSTVAFESIFSTSKRMVSAH